MWILNCLILYNYMKKIKMNKSNNYIYNALIILIKIKVIRPYHNQVVVLVKVASLLKF